MACRRQDLPPAYEPLRAHPEHMRNPAQSGPEPERALVMNWGKQGQGHRKAYPSDVSDDEWAGAAPSLTMVREDTAQRTHPVAGGVQRGALRGEDREAEASVRSANAPLVGAAGLHGDDGKAAEQCEQAPPCRRTSDLDRVVTGARAIAAAHLSTPWRA